MAGAANIKQVPAIYSGFDEIGMNTGAATASGQPIGNGNPVLKDVRVRQAINYAINRQDLVSRVLDGYGSAGSSIIPPIYANQHYTPTTDAMNYDPAKANQILDAAGYKKDSHGIRVNPKTGKEISLRLFARSDSQSSQQSVQFVANWLQAIGLKITVKVLSEDNLDEIIGDGEYDLFEFGWVVEPDPDYQLSTMTCGAAQHQVRATPTSPDCPTASSATRSTTSSTASRRRRSTPRSGWPTVKAAEKIAYDDAPYAVTYYYDDLEAYRTDRFTGWVPQPSPNGALLFQYGHLELPEHPPASRRRQVPRRPVPTTARRSSCWW